MRGFQCIELRGGCTVRATLDSSDGPPSPTPSLPLALELAATAMNAPSQIMHGWPSFNAAQRLPYSALPHGASVHAEALQCPGPPSPTHDGGDGGHDVIDGVKVPSGVAGSSEVYLLPCTQERGMMMVNHVPLHGQSHCTALLLPTWDSCPSPSSFADIVPTPTT